MKNFFISLLGLLLLATLWTACQEDDGPKLPDRLVITVNGETLINPGTILLFSANMDVDWYIEDDNGGTISEDGIYTAPFNNGTYVVRAVSQEDETLTDAIQLVVTDIKEEYKALQQGGLVLYFRHAEADSGADQSSLGGSWWKSCSADSARQLSLDGIEQAQLTGTALKQIGTPVTRILSSEFCRCIQTAELMELGPRIIEDTAITFFVYDEPNRPANTYERISVQGVPEGELTVFIGHSVGGSPPFGPMDQGDVILFRPVPGGEAEFVARVRTNDLTELARSL